MQGAVQMAPRLSPASSPVMFTWIFSKSYGPTATIQHPEPPCFVARGLCHFLFVAQLVRPAEQRQLPPLELCKTSVVYPRVAST